MDPKMGKESPVGYEESCDWGACIDWLTHQALVAVECCTTLLYVYKNPETNSKFTPENRPFTPKGKEKVFQPSISRCYVSFREGICKFPWFTFDYPCRNCKIVASSWMHSTLRCLAGKCTSSICRSYALQPAIPFFSLETYPYHPWDRYIYPTTSHMDCFWPTCSGT